MNNTTPPKHKTPNYKLVRHSRQITGFLGMAKEIVWHVWEATPLRRNRKDLAA